MSDDERYQLVIRRDARYDGVFFTGVVTTGIYCVPSCAARKPHRRNVRFFATEAEVRRAGFRPCLRCRPDRRDERGAAALLAAARRAFGIDPAAMRKLSDLAAAIGSESSRLAAAMRAEDGLSAAGWLRRERARWCGERLRASSGRTIDIAFEAGFGSEASFYRAFREHFDVAPASYRSSVRERRVG